MGNYKVIGKRVPRLDALEKVTGKARYAVDVGLPGMLTGKILRSTMPHAGILNLDTHRAARLPGVKAVLSSRNIPRIEKAWEPQRPEERRVFAYDKVCFVGDEVAAVAAVDEDTAQEALELISVDYQELPTVFDLGEAMAPGAPKVRDAEGNIAAQVCITRGDPEAAFDKADEVFEDQVATQIQNQCYLEPIGCLASYDLSGQLTLWLSSMYPSGIRSSLAEAVSLSEHQVRVIQAYVGGAFGGKICMLPIYPICALLAMKTGRPVKMTNTREEEFTSALPRLPALIRLKTGVKRGGTLLAKETTVIAGNGAYIYVGPTILTKMLVVADGLYRIPHLRSEGKLIFTNKSPVGSFRGFGTTQMTFALETHLDRIAEGLGMDSLELRMKNATQPGDLTAHGWKVGSCALTECMQVAAAQVAWPVKRKPGHGVGLSCTPYDCDRKHTDGFGGSVAFVKILEGGKVLVITGEADYGQGARTIFAQIAAEVLGVSYDRVEVTMPDTDATPYALGPWALRVTVSGGNAVKLAAEDARDQLFDLAAEKLEANTKDLQLGEERIFVRGSPEKGLTLGELAKGAILRRGGCAIMGKGIDEAATVPFNRVTLYGNTSRAYIFASQAVEIEVDEASGRLKIHRIASAHDIGRAINPASAEGQVEGGIATGLGFALTEEVLWDEGRVLNPNFLDYRVPTAADMPPLETHLIETDEPKTVFGAKGIGMPGTILPAPALANALYRACGVRINSLPITPDKILRALEEKAGKVELRP